MIRNLKLVHGAVSKKELVPVLTHFCVYAGRVQGSNGKFYIDAPVPELEGHEMTVNAKRFLAALDAAGDNVKLKVGEGSITVSSGRFRAKVPTTAELFPRADAPNGDAVPCDGLVAALRRLTPFIGEDATRDWARGVLLRGGKAYATNNVVLAAADAPDLGTDIIIPAELVDELIRIGDDPDVMLLDGSSVGFYWGDAWLRGKLLAGEWPNVDEMIAMAEGDLPELPEGLADSVVQVKPFANDLFPSVKFTDDGLESDGATVEGYDLPHKMYHLPSILAVLGQATHADFSQCPSPWSGEGILGLLIEARP